MVAFQPADLGNPARRVGRSVEYHEQIGSTNDRARECLRAGEDGIVVVADQQTAGRGRRGRSWQSPLGVNLMLSAGVRIGGLPAEAAWQLGAATALAVRTACAPYASLQVKWPNDLVTREGAKVAGLLLETALADDRLVQAIVGIGINVNWRRGEMPEEIAAHATSLRELGVVEVDRMTLLSRLLDELDAEVLALERGESPLARLRTASWLDGRPVRVTAEESEVEGVVAGIGDDGALVVETERGRQVVSYGEVVAVALPA
ncbi:MAG: biotin--[acetyl-CoA-carboxylase] ligase [Chloroflexota bacterium]|nr:biotin--[acetyl-CoA-carboxylase] ligase [Chloroflexota bacterium]